MSYSHRADYDLLIIGAGIAGLHVATRYLKAHPTHSVCVIERNNYLGGRIYTHHQSIKGKGQYQWEAGAGRIALTHKRVIGLIREYGLTFTKWTKERERRPEERERRPEERERRPKAGKRFIENGPFPSLVPIYLNPLLSLKPSVLAQNTLDTLLTSIYGSQKATTFMSLFPYWAEFHTLRADVALDAFLHGPLGGHTGYGGCVEGLSVLADEMGKDITKRGGVIRLGTPLLDIQEDKEEKEQGPIRVLVQSKDSKKEWLEAKRVVLAMDATSLQRMEGLKAIKNKISALNHLTTEPLFRIYAVFPTGLVPPKPQGGDKNSTSWFSGMDKVVVPGPIRFFIPMDAPARRAEPGPPNPLAGYATKGLAMISYMEGKDAEYWMDMPEKRREKEIMAELRRTFPDKEIPDPLLIKFHPWRSGCTYWTPSPKAYDVEEESNKSVQPIPGLPLYLCSESFAVQQSWMESALIQAEKVLQRVLRS